MRFLTIRQTATVKLFFVIVLAALVSGCAGTRNTVPSDVTLNPDSDEAIIIMSLRTTSAYASAIETFWREFDPKVSFFSEYTRNDASNTRVTGNFFLATRYDTAVGFLPASTDRLSGTEYLVFKVKAGTFALDKFAVTDVQLHRISSLKARPKTWSFSIKSNEILYIGNYLIDVPKAKYKHLGIAETYNYSAMKFKYDGEDKVAAQAVLEKRYKNLEGPIEFRKPQSIELKLPE